MKIAIYFRYAYKRTNEEWYGAPAPDQSVVYDVKFNEWGVFEVTSNQSEANLFPVSTLTEYVADHKICEIISQSKTVRTLSHHRLQTMEQLFDMHIHMNWKKEETDSSKLDAADFYSIAKVRIYNRVYFRRRTILILLYLLA